jgi:hypothetical protein
MESVQLKRLFPSIQNPRTFNELMTALRLSIFALGCVAYSGYNNFFAAIAVVLAAIVLYAFSKCKKILLAYCHVAAGILWITSCISFMVNGAPIVLIIFLFIMCILDGFFEPLHRKRNEVD